MGDGIIGKLIYFWAFMIGVIIFGKIFGFMEDTKTTVMILIGAAIIFVVWTLGRSMSKRRREEKAWQEQQARIEARRKRGNKRR